MADQVYEIELRDKASPKLRGLRAIVEDLARDFKDAGGKLDRIEDRLSAVGKTARKAAKGLGNFSGGLVSLNAGLDLARKGAGAARGLFGLFSTPVKLAVDVESGLNAIRTLSDTVTDDLAAQLKALPGEIGTSVEDTLRAAYDGVSAGINTNQIVGFLRQAGRLAKAGQADLASTAGALQQTLEAYSGQALEAERASDILFATVRVGKTTLPDLAASFGDIVGPAAQYGVSLEEAGAALAQLTKTSGSTSQAATQVRDVIKNLAKPSKETAKALEAIGVQYGVNALKAKGLTGVLEDIRIATGGNSDALSKLFRDNEANLGLLGLFRNGLQGYRTALDATRGSTGEVARGNEIMGRGLQGLLDRFSALAKGALVQVGERLLPRVAAGFERLTDYLKGDGLKQLDKYADAVVTVGNGFAFVADKAASFVGALEAVGEFLGESAAEAYLRAERGVESLGRSYETLSGRYDAFINELSGGGVELQKAATRVAELASQNSILARSAAAVQRAYLNVVSTEYLQATREAEAATARQGNALLELGSTTAQATLATDGMELSLQAASGALGIMGPTAIAVGGSLFKLSGQAQATSLGFSEVARAAARANLLLLNTPGAAVAAGAALEAALRQLDLAVSKDFRPPPRPKQPPKGAGKGEGAEERRLRLAEQAEREAEERRRFASELRIAAIRDESTRQIVQLQEQRIQALRRARELGVDAAAVDASFDARLDAARERQEQLAAERAAEVRRLNTDARIQGISDAGERARAALEVQFAQEREAYARAGADLELLLASQAQRRLTAEQAAADTRLAAQQAELAASADIANSMAGLATVIGEGSQRAAAFSTFFSGVALAANASSAAVESALEYARGNLFKGTALASASILGFARAATLKSQGRALGASGPGGGGSGAGGASRGGSAGGGRSQAFAAPVSSARRSDFGGGESTRPITINTGVMVSGGVSELSRMVSSGAATHRRGRNSWIGEVP